jgi:hypothetical protein
MTKLNPHIPSLLPSLPPSLPSAARYRAHSNPLDASGARETKKGGMEGWREEGVERGRGGGSEGGEPHLLQRIVGFIQPHSM